MATDIHPTAIVASGAKIGEGTRIGPYAIINDDVIIGENCEVYAHAYIDRFTRLGNEVRVFPSAVLGTIPQDLKFENEETELIIGDKTTVREFAMLSRGTKDRWKTEVGKNCLIMAYVHLGHDVIVDDNVILGNSVQVAGHVDIGYHAIIGGEAAIHQFCHIGEHVIIEGLAKVKKDVPPYIMAVGEPLSYSGLNKIGLERRGFSPEQINSISSAYRLYYGSGLNHTQALERMETELAKTSESQRILDFLRRTERGVIRKRG